MIYKCAVCDKTQATRAGEIPWLWPVPYVAVVRAEDDKRAGEPGYCCADCADDNSGRGRMEGNYGRHNVGVALVLDAWSSQGYEDDMMGQEEHCGRLGRYLLFVDYSGFVTFEEYKTAALAEARFTSLYSDGMGASEDDAYIADDGDVYFGGHTLHVPPARNGETSETRKRAAVRIAAAKQGFYPNLWRDNGRGNLSLLNY